MCNSLKIKNCLNLAKSYSRSEILKDSVCKVQCSFALRILPSLESASARVPKVMAHFGFSN